jgi:hypothetical protein
MAKFYQVLKDHVLSNAVATQNTMSLKIQSGIERCGLDSNLRIYFLPARYCGEVRVWEFEATID